MNKFGIVLSAAAVVTLAGCKDPDYKHASASPSQAEVKNVETSVAAAPVKTVEPAPAPTCQCPPGTKHAEPCKCGAPDCKCMVEPKAVPAEPLPPVVVAPEYTEYVVQEGDYLSKISKRYNVTLSSIRRLNPSIKKDVIRVGQKIKLPGKIDVGVQSAPVKTAVKATAKKAGATSYDGATKEYVVKNGDTLGSIAYGNGINIRQLKQLNGLTKDTLRIGQKLKIPAEKVAAAAPAKKTAAPVTAQKSVAVAPAAPTNEAPAPVVEEKKEPSPADAAAPVKAATAAETPAPAKEAAPATATYVVQEGDDMTGVSIRWGVSAAQIRELNNLGENDQLVPGQIIKLPAEAQQ